MALTKQQLEALEAQRLGSGTATLGLGIPDTTSMQALGPRPVAPAPVAPAIAAPVAAPAVATAPMPASGVRGLGLTPPSQLAAPAAAAAPLAPNERAVFGLYPQLTGDQKTTYATGNRLRQGVQAAGPDTFVPAAGLGGPLRMNNLTDPRSTQYGGTPGTPTAASAVPQPVAGGAAPPQPTIPNPFVQGTGAAAAAPAVPSAPAVLAQPGADGAQPVSVSEGPMAAPLPQAGRVTRVGNSFSGSNIGLNDPGVPTAEQAAINGANNLAAINRDIDHQRWLQTRADPNAPTPSVASATALSYGNDVTDPTGRLAASREFGDRAALDNAVRRNNGSRAGQAAVDAALQQVNARSRRGEIDAQVAGATTQTAMREAGDTNRLGIREAGDTARANQTAQITAARDRRAGATDDARTALEARGLGLKEDAARIDNATRRQLQEAQQAYLAAKTPEEQRAAIDKITVLSGKAKEDAFKAITVGGGSVADPVTGIAVPQPQSALLYNTTTGQTQQIGAGGGLGAPAAMAPRGMRQVGTANGKPVYEDANGKRFQ